MKKKVQDIVGYTKSGKVIHKDPMKNTGFAKEEHLEAYRAHANYLAYNFLPNAFKEKHLRAMDQHYRMAVSID